MVQQAAGNNDDVYVILLPAKLDIINNGGEGYEKFYRIV